MDKESGEWIIHGLDEDNPDCIRTIDEAVEYINSVGFLPLFRNEIDGFSLEERTASKYWWSGDVSQDPWAWREEISRRGEIAYGKFFDKKTGFISREWLPYFVNLRRDGYDFDARWDDEKASYKQKRVMEFFMNDNSEAEIFSNELKSRAGFGTGGDKGYDGIISGLQMQLYLCCRDFRQRTNKRGESYGWPIAIYSTPEHIFGRDCVTAAYAESPEISGNRIVSHLRKLFPNATDKEIKSIMKG